MNRVGSGTSPQRVALRNGHLVRYTASVLLNIVAEWAVFVGVLVLAFERGGAAVTGYASIALLVPYVAFAPVAAAMSERYPAQRVRIGAMVMQSVGFSIAALAAYTDVRLSLVVAPTMVAIAGTTLLGPSGAVLRPAIVRSSRELTVANLWLGYADSVSVFLGPLVATAAIAIDGPRAAIVACAALAVAALAVSLFRQPVDPPGGSDRNERVGAMRLIRNELTAASERPGVLGVLAVAGGQYFLVGALDIVLVVAAEEEFGLGPSGAGALLTALGAGAFFSGVFTTVLVRRPRIGPAIAAAMAVVAIGTIVVGATLAVVLAFVLLPIIGLARAVQDILGQILLQRSADPKALGAVFAVLELAAGLALIAGSLAAQLMLNLASVRVAFIGTGAFFGLLLLATARSLRAADASADIPVVEMSLLRRTPVFGPLPRPALEAVARSTTEVEVATGESLTVQGQPGDHYYVVADGSFTVSVDNVEVGRCERGDGFGELALLGDVPRAATVTASSTSSVLRVDRRPFLVAVTGHDSSRQAAWGVMQRLRGDDAPVAGPDDFAVADPDD